MGLWWIIYIVALLIIPIWAQFRVKKAYKKYSRVSNSSGMTGAEVAKRILNENGIYNVAVEPVKGRLSDHYDPAKKVVRLSEDNYYGISVAGQAVAAHEVGHAIQDAEEYGFLRFRSTLAPAANLGSNMSFFLIIAGVLLTSQNLILVGIVFMSVAVLFQFVTLPVEFNASNRAMEQIVSTGIIRNNEEKKTKKVLNAAALTYVAAAVVAVLELARFIFMYFAMDN
ncbi:Zn-dependent membrane protease YugP [Salibacterium salarium]|uniref:zinc metallopeptidase n=1 Tax=Salibacterium salarium TaxID=284579 RepID=UPI0027815BC0|nr:zinc metallopeptidase [Salibacterium salarium]MDQ0299419.1 Zn-dependent membrane protease YugP [Salibacterium salarium]